MQKKRRHTTMSESIGILDELSLEFADNLSCDESAFAPDAPDCSELKTPQATMNETGRCTLIMGRLCSSCSDINRDNYGYTSAISSQRLQSIDDSTIWF
jgi:hypothetical protein